MHIHGYRFYDKYDEETVITMLDARRTQSSEDSVSYLIKYIHIRERECVHIIFSYI